MYIGFDWHVVVEESLACFGPKEVETEKHDAVSPYWQDVECLLYDRKREVEWGISDYHIKL